MQRRALEVEALAPSAHSVMQCTTPWPVAFSRPSVPPRRDRLAGDDALHGLLVDHADRVHVRVHDPRHRLRVGAHVGRRDVVVGADVRAERVGEAARDALQLGARDRVRVELDAALAAAERQVHERALPRHHRRERLHVVERDVSW